MFQATFVLLALLAVSSFTIFYALKTRHIERMTRIEHGMDEPDPFAFRHSMINFGTFLIALSFGILFSYFLSQSTNLPDYVTIPGSLLLFGGISLLLIARMDGKRK